MFILQLSVCFSVRKFSNNRVCSAQRWRQCRWQSNMNNFSKKSLNFIGTGRLKQFTEIIKTILSFPIPGRTQFLSLYDQMDIFHGLHQTTRHAQLPNTYWNLPVFVVLCKTVLLDIEIFLCAVFEWF